MYFFVSIVKMDKKKAPKMVLVNAFNKSIFY